MHENCKSVNSEYDLQEPWRTVGPVNYMLSLHQTM